ncbi:hypothetical protein [Geobacter sp. DSM 9736]|uniref:hypothetical protein n=1 Tax=Geobacter sp. DSM 9736 TaxID=1277350 RepID=UPI000B50EF36|nr:hypothetical protein [Geobacter sp. DSM 9736]SNB45930.1 hypothetical protein SAMN06269301_1363 [Geobacter sp. DSM 9736]
MDAPSRKDTNVKNLGQYVESMLNKHCSCTRIENKILLETISICPECQTLFTTLIYQIPQERMQEVLERLTDLMAELGITSQGSPEGEIGFEPTGSDNPEEPTGE